ncbi:MAG: Fic family protein [Candidatus Korobacteraceae bacterium]
MNTTSYRWKPITALPENISARPELNYLADVWNEQKDRWSDESQELFLEKLQRQWAIETGIIERIYSLDRGITEVLIEKGINANLIPSEATDKDPELVAAIISDQKEAIEWVFDFVKGNRQLSTSYIKEIQALLTRHQHTTVGLDAFGRRVEVKLEKGTYKTWPNNPSRQNGTAHEYCPPEHVSSEMDRLIELFRQYEDQRLAPDLLASWLHHRFTQIHPFQDGNGRVARTLASLVFIKSGWFPLVVTRDDREPYILALERADEGDISPLVSLFAAIQRQAFVNALSIAGDVRQRQQVRQVIEAARETFERRQEALGQEWEGAKDAAAELHHKARGRFDEVAESLTQELASYSSKFSFYVDDEVSNGDRDYYFRNQVIQTAKQLGYFANPSLHASWVRLVLRTETQAEVLLSFHGIGHEFRGVLVASMCFFRREEVAENEREVADLIPVSDHFFQINYREARGEALNRFNDWLEAALIKALETWRMGL